MAGRHLNRTKKYTLNSYPSCKPSARHLSSRGIQNMLRTSLFPDHRRFGLQANRRAAYGGVNMYCVC
jgi:hypothetical protein